VNGSPVIVEGDDGSLDRGVTRAAALRRWQRLAARPETTATLLADSAAGDLEPYARQIEHFVGTLKVPVGVAGPLRIAGQHAVGDFYVPLATTEGALVASYSRGARLITISGGCRAAIVAEALARAPAFAFATLADAVTFASWIPGRLGIFAEVVASTTRHGRLLGARTAVEANHVYVTFEFATADAAGQNMVTLATEALLAHIEVHAPVRIDHSFIESNHAGDKKASARALLGVRGRRVCAETEIPGALIASQLHTSAEQLCEFWRMAVVGSALAGTLGFNAQYANALAALYLACGQDVACVAESAVGITRLEAARDGALYASVTLPNLVLGTVGGGSHLPGQRACLDVMGLAGPGHARALAEVAAAICLAGELSLAGAICAGEFARAHRVLGRPGGHGGAP
jgi:hydroxymethylglutaryl-CoA reductase (NADPH)